MTNYNDGKIHGWSGGECPVHPKSEVEISYGWRWILEVRAENVGWSRPQPCLFRVTKEYKEPREFWVSDNDGYAHKSLENVLKDHLTEKHGYIHVREVKQ